MAACLHCGKKIETEYLLWKGGASRAICEECQAEEYRKEKGKKRENDNNHS